MRAGCVDLNGIEKNTPPSKDAHGVRPTGKNCETRNVVRQHYVVEDKSGLDNLHPTCVYNLGIRTPREFVDCGDPLERWHAYRPRGEEGGLLRRGRDSVKLPPSLYR